MSGVAAIVRAVLDTRAAQFFERASYALAHAFLATHYSPLTAHVIIVATWTFVVLATATWCLSTACSAVRAHAVKGAYLVLFAFIAVLVNIVYAVSTAAATLNFDEASFRESASTPPASSRMPWE